MPEKVIGAAAKEAAKEAEAGTAEVVAEVAAAPRADTSPVGAASGCSSQSPGKEVGAPWLLRNHLSHPGGLSSKGE